MRDEREIWPNKDVGELIGVNGDDVGRFLDEFGERNNVGEM